MLIGYARVSTDDQSIDLQVDALNRVGCKIIYTDKGISGVARRRPGLDSAFARLSRGDQLVIWKLDRLGRSLSDLVERVNLLERRGIGLISISEVINTSSPGGVLIFHIMAALAEFERALISERTKAGMHSARSRGRRLGRPRKLSENQVAFARSEIQSAGVSIARAADRLGVSRATIYRAIKGQAAPTMATHRERRVAEAEHNR